MIIISLNVYRLLRVCFCGDIHEGQMTVSVSESMASVRKGDKHGNLLIVNIIMLPSLL